MSQWRLQSPASRLFNQPFNQAQMRETSKAPRHWPLWGEFAGDQWIPCKKGQWRVNVNLITSSWTEVTWIYLTKPKYHSLNYAVPSNDFLHRHWNDPTSRQLVYLAAKSISWDKRLQYSDRVLKVAKNQQGNFSVFISLAGWVYCVKWAFNRVCFYNLIYT